MTKRHSTCVPLKVTKIHCTPIHTVNSTRMSPFMEQLTLYLEMRQLFSRIATSTSDYHFQFKRIRLQHKEGPFRNRTQVSPSNFAQLMLLQISRLLLILNLVFKAIWVVLGSYILELSSLNPISLRSLILEVGFLGMGLLPLVLFSLVSTRTLDLELLPHNVLIGLLK